MSQTHESFGQVQTQSQAQLPAEGQKITFVPQAPARTNLKKDDLAGYWKDDRWMVKTHGDY